MLQISWEIKIGNFRLGLLDSVKIHRSVDLLADTAEIVLPAVVQNKALEIEDRLKRGDQVVIRLGYDGELIEEFSGYLQEIALDGGNIKLQCEDSLFLFRKPVTDRELKNVTLEGLLELLIRETGVQMQVKCSYMYNYEKFVISRATAYDILKKIQEETKANIYMKGRELHVHPAYEEVFGEVKYDFARNIEKDSLVYKKAAERKYEVEVEGQTKDGKSVKVTVGKSGGDRKCVKVYGVSDPELLKKRGEQELKHLSYDGYEGDLSGWLIPFCDAGYVVVLHDEEYPQKDGKYYVTAVSVEAGPNGASRKVQLGMKM